MLSASWVLTCIHSLVPVSYTHLDVYKRQLIHVQPAGGPTAQGEYVGLLLRCAMAFQPSLLSLIHISNCLFTKIWFGIIPVIAACPWYWFFTFSQGIKAMGYRE